MQELINAWNEYSKENFNQYGQTHTGEAFLVKIRSFKDFMDWLSRKEERGELMKITGIQSGHNCHYQPKEIKNCKHEKTFETPNGIFCSICGEKLRRKVILWRAN